FLMGLQYIHEANTEYNSRDSAQWESHKESIIKDSITKGVTYGINYQRLNHKGSHIWYQLSRTQSQRESHMVSIIKDSIKWSQSWNQLTRTRSIGVNHGICYQDSIKRSQRWNLLLRLNQKESKMESAIKTQSKGVKHGINYQ